jgi:hypothetical protein
MDLKMIVGDQQSQESRLSEVVDEANPRRHRRWYETLCDEHGKYRPERRQSGANAASTMDDLTPAFANTMFHGRRDSNNEVAGRAAVGGDFA